MQKIYGRDMFVMRSSLEGVTVSPGQMVSFRVAQGPKGPHALDVQPFSAAQGAFTGVVKSYNDTKGWGFVESAATREIFKTAIFLHRRELNGKSLASGDEIQFMVDISGGRAAAKNITIIVAGAAP